MTNEAAESLIEQLGREPWAFDFFQAVRRLEHAWPDRPRVGHARHFLEEVVHFGQQPTLAFAPRSISSVESLGDDDEGVRMLVFFLGLFGPSGPMPLHLTEFVIEWSHGRSERLDRLNRKTGSNLRVASGLATDEDRELERGRLARFFDVFHHRMISFFYRAWAHHEQTVSFDREDDPFSLYVGSLAGLAGAERAGPVPQSARLHYAGHLANARRGPEGLEAIVEDYFGVEAEVLEFIGDWVEMPAEFRTRLGVANHRLGGEELPSLSPAGSDASAADPRDDEIDVGWSEVVLGNRVWDPRQKFRLRLGPMSLDRLESLMPGGERHAELVAWVRDYAGDAYAWDLQLVLDRTPELSLGGKGQLGRTTWLAGADASRQRTNVDDLVVEPIRIEPDSEGSDFVSSPTPFA